MLICSLVQKLIKTPSHSSDSESESSEDHNSATDNSIVLQQLYVEVSVRYNQISAYVSVTTRFNRY